MNTTEKEGYWPIVQGLRPGLNDGEEPRNKENRRITRWVHETLMEEMQQRVAAHPEKVKARKGIVEHPFGTMKRGMDQGYFLTRGLVKVRGEMSLTILVYNLKRVMNILGVEALITAVVSRTYSISGRNGAF